MANRRYLPGAPEIFFYRKYLDFQEVLSKARPKTRKFISLTFILIASVSVNFFILAVFGPINSRRSKPLETQIESSLKQLQEDSSRAMTLLTKLQEEISQRRSLVIAAEEDLRKLHNERAALDLTDEQRRAIQKPCPPEANRNRYIYIAGILARKCLSKRSLFRFGTAIWTMDEKP